LLKIILLVLALATHSKTLQEFNLKTTRSKDETFSLKQLKRHQEPTIGISLVPRYHHLYQQKTRFTHE